MARGVETRIEETRSPVCDVASFMQARANSGKIGMTVGLQQIF